jgi:hypothetical protein
MNTQIKHGLVAGFVFAATSVFGQSLQLHSATISAGAARLDNGSLVNLGQPFVGMVRASDNSVSLTLGLIPTLPGQTTGTNEFTISPSMAFENGRFKFKFIVAPGRTWVVEGSTDLLDWSPVWAGTATDPWVEFEDFTAFLYPKRFYRVRLP